MSLGDRIPVEPLSDADWQDVERAVFAELSAPSEVAPARPSASRLRPAAIAAMSILAMAAALALWLRPAPESPPLHSTRIDAHGEPVEAQVGEIRLEVASESAVVIVGDDDRGWVATLERGRVTFAVPPRAARPSFVVQAADVRVEVVGTRFTVARDATDGVIVEVDHGVVRVSHREREARLAAGERFSSAIERPPAEEPAGVVRRAPTEARLEPTTAAPSASTAGGVPIDDGLPRPTPSAVMQPERAPVAVVAPPTAAEEFERASQLESSDPAQADAIYRRLSARSGPWAPAALFARARLQLERGQREPAEVLLRRYLERHPDGINAADARRLLARAAPPRD